MSVCLLIDSPRDPEGRSVPVATEEVFTSIWQPACRELGLKWVPLFQTGLAIERRDLPEILSELGLLSARLAGRPEAGHVRSRMDLLAEELRQSQSDPEARLWIG